MSQPWSTLLGLAVTLVVVWLLLVVVLLVAARRSGDQPSLREALRLLPDVLRLLRALARDDTLPRRVRVALWATLGYLLVPVDLVPDVLPVVGWADDVLVVVWVLRWVARTAGPERLAAHWPGTPAGLAAVTRLASPRR